MAEAASGGTPGWERVVEQLVTERGDALTRYAHFICGSREDAADLVQDALVKTFGRLRNGYSVASAEAYVRRAILNTYVDRGRRTTRWRKIAHLNAVADEVPSSSGDTDLAIDLHEELRKLSPRERACLMLRYYEDLKVDDIAATLELSPGAVKRYLSDGLGKMSRSLADDGSAPAAPSAPVTRIDATRRPTEGHRHGR